MEILITPLTIEPYSCDEGEECRINTCNEYAYCPGKTCGERCSFHDKY